MEFDLDPVIGCSLLVAQSSFESFPQALNGEEKAGEPVSPPPR